RGRLRRRARGLRRALHPQHQLDQFLAAQPLKIASAHPTKESAKPNPHKGVGNYMAITPTHENQIPQTIDIRHFVRGRMTSI
ncbi:hypothetical protein, partial [Methylobacterium sp. J-090]|uniref:hypothetical protein n=1 Tax=Methylobacterium sp. J-090 TaxID=2836666 RepID=UPI001FBBD717